MIDTSPDGDSFSTLWKFLTKVASQVKTSSMYNHQGCVTVPKLLGLEPGRVCEHLRISQSCSYIVYFFFFLPENCLSLSPKPTSSLPQRGHVIV